MTVVVDDHLLRDWLARRDAALQAAIGDDQMGGLRPEPAHDEPRNQGNAGAADG